MEESGPKNGARNEEQEREQESLGGIQKDDQAGRQASCWSSWAFPRAAVDKMNRAGSCWGGEHVGGKGQSASNCHVKKTNKQKTVLEKVSRRGEGTGIFICRGFVQNG